MAVNERRHLVLLFADLVDSTGLAAQMEPEQYADVLQHLRELTQTIISRHSGQIIRIDGDGMLAFFGYPDAHEDSGRRAVEAAVDLHDGIKLLGNGLGEAPISLRSGIHSGIVLLRSGDMVRGRYEMLGDATNVAARLCDAAAPGSILVSSETLGLDRHFFIHGAKRQVTISGHGDAIFALSITGRAPTPHRFATRTHDGLTPFVGRDDQCDMAMAALFDEASPAVVVISGPAGIGKSRLLGQIVVQVRQSGWAVLRGYCEAYLGAEALQPFHLMWKDVEAAAEEKADGSASALFGHLTAMARNRPLMLVIDDWQWRDDASREFLEGLILACSGTGAHPFKILLASREPDAQMSQDIASTNLPLAPLDEDSAERAITTLLHAPEVEAVTRIVAASGGNPLLIEELCHALGEGPVALAVDPRSAWFNLAVQARLAKLPIADIGILQCAAVIGSTVPVRLLATALGQDVPEAALARLQMLDFLFEGDVAGTLRFKHGLTRDAIYAGIGRHERIALHGRVAAALLAGAKRGEVDAGAIALHLGQSEQQAIALPWWLDAGDAALNAGALDRAQFHLTAAFDWLDRKSLDGDELAALRRVIRRFGRACVIDPSREHAALLERMTARADALGDAEARAFADYWTGAHYYGLGEPRRSLAALDRAIIAAAELDSPTFLVQIRANLGQTNAIAGRYHDAILHMDLAIAAKMAARQPGVASTSLAYCLSSRGLVRADMGDFEAAYADFDAAIDTLENRNDAILPSLITQRCLALIYQGRFIEAAERAEWSEERAKTSRARFLVLSARALASYARWQETGQRSWFDRFAETTLILHGSARFQRISYKYGWIAEAMADRGEIGMAQAFATHTFRRTFKGDRLGEASAARGLALLSARGHGRRRFDHYLKMAERAAAIRQSPREAALNRLTEARCLMLAHRVDEARDAADAAAAAFTGLGMTRWIAIAEQSLASDRAVLR